MFIIIRFISVWEIKKNSPKSGVGSKSIKSDLSQNKIIVKLNDNKLNNSLLKEKKTEYMKINKKNKLNNNNNN